MKRLLNYLLSSPCSHEFCWPRKTAAGAYYQVCLRCGDHYWYDWKKMRRTEPISQAEQQTLAQPIRTRWSPRARRFNVTINLQYRRKGSEVWFDGTITNLSQSGVLFSASPEPHLPRHAALEMLFEMPREISGQPHSRVICDAYVVRAASPEHPNSPIAASILEYRFLHAEGEQFSSATPESVTPTQTDAIGASSTVTHRRRFRLRPRESRSSR